MPPNHLQKIPTSPPGYPSWAAMIRFMVEAGLNQADIAAAISVSEQSVSRIAQGKTKDPSWRVGSALIELESQVRKLIAKSESEGKPQILFIKDEAA